MCFRSYRIASRIFVLYVYTVHMCVSVPILYIRCLLVAIVLSICSYLAGYRERMATLGRTSSSSFSAPPFYEGGSSSLQLQEQGEEIKSGPNHSTTVSGIEMVGSGSTTKGWRGREPQSFFEITTLAITCVLFYSINLFSMHVMYYILSVLRS